jgi:hypothetical protein
MKERPILFSAPMVRAILAGKKTQTRRIVRDLRLVPRRKVTADAMPWQTEADAERIAAVAPPRRYPATLNPHGAVCAVYGADREHERLGMRPDEFDFVCPYADGRTYLSEHRWRIDVAPSQRLWVREKFSAHMYDDGVWYWADGNIADADSYPPTSPIFMPRKVSRITLEVTSIRVERVQDISEADAVAEGVAPLQMDNGSALPRFEGLWDSINGARKVRVPVALGHPRYGIGDGCVTEIDRSGSWEANPWVWAITFARVP